MKTQDLIDLGLSQEVAEKIFVLHGKDIEKLKESALTATSDLENIKTQLTEANKQIETFKGMKTQEEVDAAVDEYKTRLEQLEQESSAKLLDVKFDHELDAFLKDVMKVKPNELKSVKAHLDVKSLREAYNEKDGLPPATKEQTEAIKVEHDILFADSNPPPKIVTGGKSQPILGDKMEDAMRKGAGLVAESKQG